MKKLPFILKKRLIFNLVSWYNPDIANEENFILQDI